MSFARNDRRAFDAARAPQVTRPRVPATGLLRLVLLAILATIAAAWGVASHYTMTRSPLRVPVAAPTPTFDADAGELPVPDLEPAP